MNHFKTTNKFAIWKASLLFIGFILIYLFTYATLPQIPFHPDESTQLYMSTDLDIILSDPLSLVWEKEKQADIHQHYRELDAPLTRYIIGLGRKIFNIPPLISDWNWSASWEDNNSAGAVPSIHQLLVSRGSIAFFLPISIITIFWLGKKISGNYSGIIAAILLLFNPLVLLHCRRGMAEGILLFTTLLALIGIILGERYTWFAGLTVAFAFNAKQSAIALFPVGFLSVLWKTTNPKRRIIQLLIDGIIYFAIFLLVFFLLNPLYWINPLGVMKKSLLSRQQLLKNQIEDRQEIAPSYILDTPIKRAIIPVAHLFFTDLSYSEIGNYRTNTSSIEEEYQKLFFNHARSFFIGAILFFFMLFGIIVTLIQLPNSPKNKQRIKSLILLAFFTQYAFFILFIPLPWQRYVISLVPYACIFSAVGIEEIGRLTGIVFSKSKHITKNLKAE